VSEPGKEASTVEPQEDDSGGRRLPCLSDASAMSRLLVKEALAMCSLPLTSFEGGTLVKKTLVGGLLLLACTNSVLFEEPLAVGSLFLAGASGLLNEECLILVRPQIVDGPSNPCRHGLRERELHEDWAFGCPRGQQSGSLLVFANGSLMPAFFVAKRPTNVGRGVVAFVVVEQPLRGTWGRLRPFKLQPP
jgi:hypothetical protein